MQLPSAFLDQMRGILGEALPAFLSALESPAPISIRYNPQKRPNTIIDPNQLVPWASNASYLEQRPSFTFDPYFQAGYYYVQEASSMFVEEVIKQHLPLKDGLWALDLCAAPGGKSTHLLSVLPKDAVLVSNEVINLRASILAENITRWGNSNAVVTNNDPSAFNKLQGQFDLVLVDAPCSGEGMFRKDQASIAEWSEHNVQLCMSRQIRILQEASELVKEGGLLIYSTCTYNNSEDHEVIQNLLSSGSFESLSIELNPSWGVVEFKDQSFFGYHFFPHLLRGEGFYISVLRRKSDQPKHLLKTSKEVNTIDKKTRIVLNDFVDSSGLTFIKHQNNILAFPEQCADRMLPLLSTGLHLKKFGTDIGEVIREDFIPHHPLALSLIPHSFESISLSMEQAISFLQRNDPKISTSEKGWRVLSFEDAKLGFGKFLGNRMNSSLPKEWRIRDAYAL